jgi:hypothetical protein
MSEMSEENIKEIYEGATVRIEGIIYKVKSIEKSPWIIEKGVDQYIFSLEFVERDFGEMLADMAKK